jgi:hypothetical protein
MILQTEPPLPSRYSQLLSSTLYVLAQLYPHKSLPPDIYTDLIPFCSIDLLGGLWFPSFPTLPRKQERRDSALVKQVGDRCMDFVLG